MTQELIQEAVNTTNSIVAASVKLGISRYKLYKFAKQFNVELKPNISGKGIPKTKRSGRGKFALDDILNGKHPQYSTNNLKWRLINEGLKENKCEICGINEWNEKELICELDHINGNNRDHSFKNLRIICPNCHSQTDTFCGKNKH